MTPGYEVFRGTSKGSGGPRVWGRKVLSWGVKRRVYETGEDTGRVRKGQVCVERVNMRVTHQSSVDTGSHACLEPTLTGLPDRFHNVPFLLTGRKNTRGGTGSDLTRTPDLRDDETTPNSLEVGCVYN